MSSTAIVSGKGGVGKSTVSVLLAQAMAARGRRVLLIDCDIGLRSLDLILNLDEGVLFTWADVILGRCALPQAVMAYAENIHLLCAPLQLEPGLQEDMLQKLVATCGEYDEIFIDAPAGVGFGFRANSDDGHFTKLGALDPHQRPGKLPAIGGELLSGLDGFDFQRLGADG